MATQRSVFLTGTLILFLSIVFHNAGAQTAPDPKLIEGAKKEAR